eukprot:g21955.t1
MGTGIVVDSRGYIVTNHHVVDRVDSLRVTLFDGSTYTATVVSYDRKHDLAIIKIKPSKPLPVMKMGTSSDLMLGESVFAVGNAFGYENTVTSGIVSALSRDVDVNEEQSYKNLIQTDASINPGNSGGPLINMAGEVVGVNVAIRAGAQRIGFAIPIDDARRIVSRLLSIEHLDKHYHGLRTRDLKTRKKCALVVSELEPRSPALKAGFQPGDVVLKAGSIAVTDGADFERALLGRPVGDKVAVTVQRGGRQKSLTLVIGKYDRALVVRANNDVKTATPQRRGKTWQTLGLQLEKLENAAQYLSGSRYRGGMRVVAVRSGGPAEVNGIRKGDILVGLHIWETESAVAAIFRPVLTTLLVLSAAAPALAQGNAAPNVTITQSGADNLYQDLEFILLSNPKNDKAWKDLKAYIDVYLNGMDRDRPVRVDVVLGEGPTRFNFALPIKDRAQLDEFIKKTLAPIGLEFKRSLGTLYRCRTNVFTGYLRFKHKYAVIAEKKADIPFSMPDPIKGVRDIVAKYDVALHAKNTKTAGPDLMTRRTWFQNNRKEIEPALKQKKDETESEFKIRKMLLRHQLNEAERFYAESEELLLGWTTDVTKKEGRLELLLTPISGTSLYDSMQQLGVKPNHFANIKRAEKSILSVRINHPLDSKRQSHFIEAFGAFRDLAVEKINANTKHTAAEKQAGTKVADLIVKLLTANVEEGMFDAFAEVHENANKKNTAICGMRTKDGTIVVDILKEYAKTGADRKVKLDVAKEGDVRIHTAHIDIKQHPSFSFFVGDDKVFIGSSKGTIWMASGVNALDELKAAIKKTAEPNKGNPADPFVDVFVKVGPWLQLHQERRGNEGDVEARKNALEAFKPGIDNFTLQLRREKESVVGEMLVQADILRYAGNVIAKILKEQLPDDEDGTKKKKTK